MSNNWTCSINASFEHLSDKIQEVIKIKFYDDLNPGMVLLDEFNLEHRNENVKIFDCRHNY